MLNQKFWANYFKVYDVLNEEWSEDIRFFTENEFKNVVKVDNRFIKKSSEEITLRYNEDIYNPRDGELIKAVDELTAFVEAYVSHKYGITSSDLENAKNKYKTAYRDKHIAGINFGALYENFD